MDDNRKGDSKSRVAVVIPVYRASLSNTERLSLSQCYHVLREYPIVFVAPEGLDLGEYLSFGEAAIERFPKKNFTSVKRYNRMLLGAAFYRRFCAFEYILIYQLDALVFDDRLLEFCDKGWDYVGAPWPEGCSARPWNFPGCGWVARVFPWLNRQRRYYVGNGGFSLRRVQAIIEALTQHRLNARLTAANEDLFLASCADSKRSTLRVATRDEAVRFAFEQEPRDAVKRNNGQVPFGCHAWEKYDPHYVVEELANARESVGLARVRMVREEQREP